MGGTNKKSISQILESALPAGDGRSFLMFDVGGVGEPSVVSAQDFLFQPIMETIASDDADGLFGVFSFATGFRVDLFSMELPLVNLDTEEESMVSIPIMCYAMDREACFSVAIDQLLSTSRAPNNAHPMLHQLVGEIGNSLGVPGIPPPRERMLYKLMYGFMEVVNSHGELEKMLRIPLPQPILNVAMQVMTSSRSRV